MQNIDLLLKAGWIIPVEPANTVLNDHALAVQDGRIVDLLPSDRAAQQYRAAETVDMPDQVLVPGLINAHSHAAMSLMRGVADDLPLMDWLQGHIWPLEGQFVDGDFCATGVELAIAEMLRGGTTCMNDMYFFPESTAAAASRIGMRACVGMIVLDFPSAWAANADEYLARGTKLHDEYRGSGLISTAFAPHAPYTVSDEPLIRIRSMADELDVAVHMHLHETAGEVSDAVSATGMRPLQRIADLGLVNERLLAVHMTQLEDAEIESLASSGAHVVHCPESNMKLASGSCPVHKLLSAGVNVALGTDGAASNNDLDMFGEMRSAALLGKLVADDASAVPAAAALQMATLNAARALGFADLGALVPGYRADICSISLTGLEQQPMYDAISQIVYAGSRDCVRNVWVAGRQMLRERELTTIDTSDLLQRVRAWQSRIDKAGQS